MYRTDKQFMKNPATAGSRIYIGGIPNTVVADDLEIKFKRHGNILGLVLQKGFAFIQFDTEDQAHNAINIEHGSLLHGKKINVKPALRPNVTSTQAVNTAPPAKQPVPPVKQPAAPEKQSAPPAKQTPPPAKPSAPSAKQPAHPAKQPVPPVKQPTPVKQSAQQAPAPPKSTPPAAPPISSDTSKPKRQEPEPPNIQDEAMEEFEQMDDEHCIPPPEIRPPNPPRGQPSPDPMEDRGRKIRGRLDGRGGHRGREGRFPTPHEREMFRDAPPPYFENTYNYPPEEPYNKFANPPPIIMNRPGRNDCEIIVVAKALTEYAEFIEQRLKSIGLIVDLLFPNEDVPIGRVLANISSRGCLYAILVMPQNEENKSLTLSILHGVSQEHRNMPVEDALILISSNFNAYMRGAKTGSDNPTDSMRLSDKHPTAMQMLLNMLAENRLLTSVQYDKLLKYLEERLQLQQQFEVDEGIEVNSDGSTHKQTELQNRIMNILNKSADGPPEALLPTPMQPPQPPGGPTPLLKDPSVQKALDSLMLGDMFKSMAGV